VENETKVPIFLQLYALFLSFGTGMEWGSYLDNLYHSRDFGAVYIGKVFDLWADKLTAR
jgi:hypothetical protein